LIAKENNWNNILILEDDVELLPNFQEIIKQLPQLLWDSGFAWDVCFLGYTEPQKPFKILARTASCELVQFSGCNATHAYLLNSSARDWIITQLPEPDQIWQWTARYRAIDRWYRRNLSRNFVVTALSNSLFNQSYGFSDIECRKKSLTDEVCVTNISVQSKPKGLFNWHLRMKVLKNRMLLAYDYLRATSKRLNGF
jgi:GR25 family glycosyltransferase involved in LPS biosynthesis